MPAHRSPPADRVGKTTAADLFGREIGEREVLVPEAATILFQGGFPRSNEAHLRRFAQTAIFHVQRDLEDVQAALYPGRVLLCDRGTINGAAYWPGDAHNYFHAVGTTLVAELRRYDAVIFFESAAVGGASIEGGNPGIESAIRALIAHLGAEPSLRDCLPAIRNRKRPGWSRGHHCATRNDED